MKCEDLLKALSDYLDGDIDPQICQELEKHLAECDPCQVVIDNLKKTILLYRKGEPFPLPTEFQERLHSLIRERWKAHRKD
ncbi:MAG: anti-sigma factor [Armatimonadetes bacterium]|nr:anti-sigma factor [Armatimonadota bacterium]MDW8121261.1 anti-sigma factor [Armatimonadota bacterium]